MVWKALVARMEPLTQEMRLRNNMRFIKFRYLYICVTTCRKVIPN